MNKYIYVFSGIVLAIFGFCIIIQPRWYSSKYERYFDFTGVHIPLGSLFIVIGLLFVWVPLRKKAKAYEDKFLICPKRETSYNKKEVPDNQCPRCKIELEDLDGFYARHPELKPAQKGK
jgi:putative Mn2+ efflux pump MntP